MLTITRKSHRFHTDTMLRRFSSPPSGNGQPRAMSFARRVKLPGASGPYTMGARTITAAVSEPASASRTTRSASALLRA